MSIEATLVNQNIFCALCQNSLSGQSRVLHSTSETVSHVFHLACGNSWLQNHQSCPLCNKQLTLAEKNLFFNLPHVEDDREKPLTTAVRQNNLGQVQELLTNQRILDNDYLLAVSAAIENGNMGILQMLIQNGTLSDDDQNEAIVLAAIYGRLEMIQKLSNNRPIEPIIQKLIVIAAAKYGHHHVVESFINSIDEESRGFAVINAAEKGHLNILQFLLANGPISQTHRGMAMKAALQLNISISEPLVAQLAQSSIPPEDLEFMACKLASQGCLPALLVLLTNNPLSEASRGLAAEQAAEKNHFIVMQAILDNGPISEKKRDKLLKLVAALGDLTLVQAVLNHGPVSEKGLGKAAELAAFEGRPHVISLLRSKGCILEKERLTSLNLLDWRAHPEIVSELIFDPITNDTLAYVMSLAIKNNQISVLKDLLATATITDENRQKLLQYADQRHNQEAIQILQNP